MRGGECRLMLIIWTTATADGNDLTTRSTKQQPSNTRRHQRFDVLMSWFHTGYLNDVCWIFISRLNAACDRLSNEASPNAVVAWHLWLIWKDGFILNAWNILTNHTRTMRTIRHHYRQRFLLRILVGARGESDREGWNASDTNNWAPWRLNSSHSTPLSCQLTSSLFRFQ